MSDFTTWPYYRIRLCQTAIISYYFIIYSIYIYKIIYIYIYFFFFFCKPVNLDCTILVFIKEFESILFIIIFFLNFLCYLRIYFNLKTGA